MQDDVPEPSWLSHVEPFVQSAMQAAGFDGEEVSILFCNDAFIQQLNHQYRDIDNATDVLSFENGESYEDEHGTVWKSVGDIVISLETLPKNAAYFTCTEDEELKRLLLHGLLHLNGMDHGEEHIEPGVAPAGEMLSLQEKLLSQLQDKTIMNG